MIKSLCEDKTNLSKCDIERLEDLCKNLQYTADLVNSDVFVDCKARDNDDCIVVAHARPSFRYSNYETNVVGSIASREREPAVYNTFKTGAPNRDLKAITQEDIVVKQDAVPIKNDNGEVIAVIISEKDITQKISDSKKLESLSKTAEENNPKVYGNMADDENFDSSITTSEIHHRIKNNLQMVASMLNIQANRSDSNKIKVALKENINRVLSISSVHDILTNKEINGEVSIKELLKKIIVNARQFYFTDDSEFSICLDGDDILLSPDIATSVAIVANELLSNAISHGFKDSVEGNVKVSVIKGELSSSVTIIDDGCGFDTSEIKEQSVGLKLVQSIVKDKLKGNLCIESNSYGTTVKFDFKN